MTAYNIGVVPANIGLETSTTAVAVVKFIDTWETLRRPRTSALREVRAARVYPVDISRDSLIEKVAELAAEHGPGARVIYSKEHSHDTRLSWSGAKRAGRLANHPRAVTIGGGEGVGTDAAGDILVSATELINALREMVKTRSLILPADAEGIKDILAAARTIDPGLTDAGKMRFPSRWKDGRIFALALAVYPLFHPPHADRSFRVTNPNVFSDERDYASYREAIAHLGQMAKG